MEHKEPYHTESLETCVRHRHIIRFYTDEDVDEHLLYQCIALAQLAPSNSNIQNWRLHLARGAARDRVVAALRAEAEQKGPNIPELPENFKHYRSDLGRRMYGEEGYGIGRDEEDKRQWATMRNFEFFGAPICGILTTDAGLQPVDAMSVGMFAQTLMLALTEQGLGTILEVSITGFPEVLRREFKLPENQEILCGIAVGYPAKHNKVNDLVMSRDDVDKVVTFHHE